MNLYDDNIAFRTIAIPPWAMADHLLGGAKGIGKSIVESYLAEGANVSFCGRTIRGDEFSTFKGAAENARAVGSLVDISRASDIEAWVSKANQEFGKIDIVVANGMAPFSIRYFTMVKKTDVSQHALVRRCLALRTGN